jgi:hypothetical protein
VLRPGGRFLVNAFVRDSKDGRGVGPFAAVSANEVEQVVRLRERLYQVGESGDPGGGGDSGDELVAEREAPLASIPKRQVEMLYEQAGFSELSLVGGFDEEPLETVNQERVVGGHPTDPARRKTSVKDGVRGRGKYSGNCGYTQLLYPQLIQSAIYSIILHVIKFL